MRGGVQHKPLDIVNAGQYAKAQNIPIVLNTPFTIIKTILIDNIEPVNYFSEEEIEKYYDTAEPGHPVRTALARMRSWVNKGEFLFFGHNIV